MLTGFKDMPEPDSATRHSPLIAGTATASRPGGDLGAARLTLHPPIEPYTSGRFETGDGHTIYYEECGNPRGEPVVVVHGGPGGGANPTMRRFHDP
ncbi:MAG: prolyl aminopeptidase, partial [Hyphomicrobiaceae bacterium]|nr:prolyl aminopeptidase [Hyphomicrobiaceae bacterium]